MHFGLKVDCHRFIGNILEFSHQTKNLGTCNTTDMMTAYLIQVALPSHA